MQATNYKVDLPQVINTLEQAQRVLLCTHINPDGDAIGSLLATGMLLQAKGKQPVMLCQDPVPDNLKVIPGWQQVLSMDAYREKYPEGFSFDLAMSVDASDLARLGDVGLLFLSCPKTLLVDHHASNTLFARKNYVDDSVAATGNLVYRLFEAWQVAISQEAATCLYASLSSDTGNFSFGQMDEEFFYQLAGLMKAGLDISSIARRLHLTKDMSYYRLLGKALGTLQFDCDGKLSSMQLVDEDFASSGARRDQAEGLVNMGLYITGVQMSFLATQEADGVKFSLRCLPPHNVANIAVEFGGGGHVLAAGCAIKQPMELAIKAMRNRMMQAVCP